MARLRGAKWVGDAIVNNERKRLAFKTREEAEKFEQDPYSFLSVKPKAKTIGKLWPKWAREIYGRTRNERNALRITDELVQRLGAELHIEDIDRTKIKELVVKLKEKGSAPSTINSKLATLSRLLEYAVEEGLLNEKPTIRFQKLSQGRVRSLTKEEEDKIIGGLSLDLYRHYANFLLYTGCRVSEALKLEWSDIDGDVVTFWRTKTDRPRSVPLAAKAKEALAWTKAQGWKRPFEGIVYISFLHAWNRSKKKAGLEHDKQVVPHILRHTCATRLGKGNGKSKMDPLRLQAWLGHSTLQMTARYTHLDVSDLRIGTDVLE